MEDYTAQNQRNLRRLVLSVQASYGRLNLLLAICDNWKYRDQLIGNYEAELAADGANCYRVQIDRRQPSLKQSLLELSTQTPELNAATTPALVTIVGADELLGIALNDPKSAQQRFFFSLQWTRESLREFQFPIVLWLTEKIATALSQQAPDFWSWRGGVFEFVQPLVWTANPEPIRDLVLEANPPPDVDPVALQQQIDDLQAQDPTSPLLASLYQSLGQAYEANIRYAEAEVPYRQALKLREQQLGSDHLDVASSLNTLALLYLSQGRYSEAEPLLERALAIDEQQLGSNHPHVATSLNNLAESYESQGRYSEAEPLLERALAIREQQLGSDHPDVANSLNNLAGLYESQGRYSEAEPLLERALAICEQQLGNNHPNVATSLNNLAELFKCQKRYSEAEPLFQHALAVYEQQLGGDHPDVANNLNNLASLYKSQERYSEAEALFKRALQICKQQLGSNHPKTLQVANNFLVFLQTVIDHNQTEILSDHPWTEAGLQTLQERDLA